MACAMRPSAKDLPDPLGPRTPARKGVCVCAEAQSCASGWTISATPRASALSAESERKIGGAAGAAGEGAGGFATGSTGAR